MTTCWPGVTERSTCWPTACSVASSTNSRDHRQRDIGLEQRNAHLAHRLAHVGLVERAAPAQAVEDAAQPIAQAVEHAPSPLAKRKSAGGRNLAGQRASMDAIVIS